MTEKYEDSLVEDDFESIGKTTFLTIVIIEIVALSIALSWGFLRRISWWSHIHLNGDVLWGIALGIFIALINLCCYFAGRRLALTNFDWIINKIFYPAFRYVSPGQIIVLALLSGVCEEGLFRGVIQKEWGILAASLIFGILHTGNRRLFFMGIWAALMGYVLGISYEMKGNLIVPMIAHGINNLINVTYLRFMHVPSPGERD